jgi:hypothetical protein
MRPGPRADAWRHIYEAGHEPSGSQEETALSIDDEKGSEEESKAMKQAQRRSVEPGAESREEAGSEEAEAELGEDSDDEMEGLEEQGSDRV